MPWQTQPVEMPIGTDFNALIEEAGKDGIKTIDMGETGPGGGPLFMFIGGNQGQIISMLTRIGVTPAEYNITKFDLT